jgi:hypothetical protein
VFNEVAYNVQALMRDYYRCVMTGAWDRASLTNVNARYNPNDAITPTEAAHILPFSLMSIDSIELVRDVYFLFQTYSHDSPAPQKMHDLGGHQLLHQHHIQ